MTVPIPVCTLPWLEMTLFAKSVSLYPDTSALVDKLDAAGAKGTFFFTGTLYGERDIQVEYKPVVELKARVHLQPESCREESIRQWPSGFFAHMASYKHPSYAHILILTICSSQDACKSCQSWHLSDSV
jgi:hypothetical protein